MNEKLEVDLVTNNVGKPIKKPSIIEGVKEEARFEARKRKFFREVIEICLCDEEGAQLQSWNVQRLRLTPDFIQVLVDRHIASSDERLGATLAYLKNIQDHEIIVPDDMQLLCRPRPASYRLFLSTPTRTMDVKIKKSGYSGNMKFLIRHVPDRSQNNIHLVKTEHIKEWLINGIISEDPVLTKMKKKIEGCKKEITMLESNMRKVPKEPMFDTKGRLVTGKKADAQREIRYQQLKKDRDGLRIENEGSIEALQQVKEKKLAQMELDVADSPELEGNYRNTWTAQFCGEYKDFFESIVINKNNWKTSLMYARSTNFLEQNTNSDLGDYIVNSGAICVERVESGFGSYHRRELEDEPVRASINSWRSFDYHVDSYHGIYKDGLRHGHGLLYTSAGIYGGAFETDQPCGEGVMICHDGDVIKGNFSSIQPTKTSQLKSNRYARGLANGKCIVTFSDGAFYEGEMVNSKIEGKGVYITSTGERQEGIFSRGSLIDGTITKSCGDVLEGKFRNTLLCGKGICESKSKRSTYKGHFIDGEKHGWGEEVFHDRSGTLSNRYSGFFCNGFRSGTGRLSYYDTGFGNNGDREMLKSDLILDSPWLAGNPKSDGVIGQVSVDTSMPTSDVLQSKYQWLYRLKRIEKNRDDKRHENYVIEQQNELNLRTLVEQKRIKIFDSQRKSLIKNLNDYYHQLQRSFDNTKSAHSKQKRNLSTLPSRTSYYAKRKINIAPQSLEEAQQKPGLRMKECILRAEDKLIPQLVKEMEAKWKRIGIPQPSLTTPMKLVREEYDHLEERWKLINCEKLTSQ